MDKRSKEILDDLMRDIEIKKNLEAMKEESNEVRRRMLESIELSQLYIRKIMEDTKTHESPLFFMKLGDWMMENIERGSRRLGAVEKVFKNIFASNQDFQSGGWVNNSSELSDENDIGYVMFDNDNKEIKLLTVKEADDIKKQNNSDYAGKGYCEYSISVSNDTLQKRIISGETFKLTNDGQNPAIELFAIRGNEMESVKQIHAESGGLSYSAPSVPQSSPSLKM